MLLHILTNWNMFAGVAVLLFAFYIVKSNKYIYFKDLLNNSNKPTRHIVILAVLFAILLTFNKILQYMLFQNQAFDLGIFTNVLYNTSIGNLFYNGIIGINHLYDHFSPVLLLFVPFFILFESGLTLLILQSIALSMCLPLSFNLARQLGFTNVASALLSLIFVFNPYFHNIHNHDFHAIVFWVPLMLMAMQFFITRKWRFFWMTVPLLLLVREDAALMSAVLGAWIWIFFNDSRKHGCLLFFVSLSYFLVVYLIIMPNMGQEGQHHAMQLFNGLRFAVGDLFSGNILRFVSFVSLKIFNVLSLKSVFYLLLSFLFIPLFGGKYTLLLVAPAAINILSDFGPMYMFKGHYVSLMLPFLFLSALYGLKNIMKIYPKTEYLYKYSVVLSLVLIGLTMFFIKRYASYEPIEMIKARWDAVRLIPRSARVSAQTNILPQLAAREHIYMFPLIKDAEYVIIDLNNQAFSVPIEYARTAYHFETENNLYEKIYDKHGVKLFKRI